MTAQIGFNGSVPTPAASHVIFLGTGAPDAGIWRDRWPRGPRSPARRCRRPPPGAGTGSTPSTAGPGSRPLPEADEVVVCTWADPVPTLPLVELDAVGWRREVEWPTSLWFSTMVAAAGFVAATADRSSRWSTDRPPSTRSVRCRRSPSPTGSRTWCAGSRRAKASAACASTRSSARTTPTRTTCSAHHHRSPPSRPHRRRDRRCRSPLALGRRGRHLHRHRRVGDERATVMAPEPFAPSSSPVRRGEWGAASRCACADVGWQVSERGAPGSKVRGVAAEVTAAGGGGLLGGVRRR